jgi:hypothetical protein
MSIFVDDTTLTGSDEAEVLAARDRILEKFPGKIVGPEKVVTEEDGSITEYRDILGCLTGYNRERREVSFSIEKVIDALIKEFNVQGKATHVPVVKPVWNAQGSEKNEPISQSDFPMRSLCGKLQYVSMYRPDVAFAVNKVSKFAAKPDQESVKAAKKILLYLRDTKARCVKFSPETERKFRETYEPVAQATGKKLGDWVCFSDSDFAGCTLTCKSTSGTVLCYKGTPVAWRSRLQGVRSYSTCEAEYLGLYDAIRLVQGSPFVEFFGGEVLFLGDNKSAIDLSSSSIVTRRSKHIDIRFHLVRDFSEQITHVPTALNLADSLTKPVQGATYTQLIAE